jgi:hypothetical protein
MDRPVERVCKKLKTHGIRFVKLMSENPAYDQLILPVPLFVLDVESTSSPLLFPVLHHPIEALHPFDSLKTATKDVPDNMRTIRTKRDRAVDFTGK